MGCIVQKHSSQSVASGSAKTPGRRREEAYGDDDVMDDDGGGGTGLEQYNLDAATL